MKWLRWLWRRIVPPAVPRSPYPKGDPPSDRGGMSWSDEE